ncbi:IS66 family insertion sequence element accessory protein TnpB [Hungatella hathewayi]|uniref:Transposase n=1 Tax=Hungatella hathewayi WAL-18680 TaxID=742737 RepID=G5IB51_9FIRM|nr:hypothetical protein HMPREF9473_00728 [ [Hungatella hathewayi WAL-18680]
MLGDISVVDNVYIVCGTTNMRRSIDGLCYIIRDKLSMNPDQSSLFLFCWKRCDWIKILLHEPAGYVLLYKRLSVTQGRYRWPQKSSEIQAITWRQLDWILSSPKQSKPVKKIHREIAEIFRRHFSWMCG